MRKIIIVPALILGFAAFASPALALSCNGGGFDLSFSIGEPFTEQDNADMDLFRLRATGVDASSVEYWNGCIRAFVKNEDRPGEHMEFFDPRTLRRVG